MDRIHESRLGNPLSLGRRDDGVQQAPGALYVLLMHTAQEFQPLVVVESLPD
ncbi:MAG: hypothetical protein INE95_06640 [Phenylobacterium sp.]|nr:hypothetical protein [Phenylobacterium sp.]